VTLVEECLGCVLGPPLGHAPQCPALARLAEGAIFCKALEGGFEVTVLPMVLGRARVCFGEQREPCYLNAYCYDDRQLAIRAAVLWDGEDDPIDGWTRHPNSGRRRTGGDPAKETVGP
jgi:hypothetical protein